MELTNEQWAVLDPLIPEPHDEKMGKAGRDATHEKFSKVSAGCCEREHNRLIYLKGIRPTKRAIGVFRSGCKAAYCKAFWSRWLETEEQRGELNPSECFIDGTFVVAKKGGQESVYPKGTM